MDGSGPISEMSAVGSSGNLALKTPQTFCLTDPVEPQKDSGIAEECYVQRTLCSTRTLVGSSCLLSGSGHVVLNDKVASDGTDRPVSPSTLSGR